MPWVKLDDHFDENPKIARVGPLGMALYVTGLAYCNRNLTDGFIPWGAARRLLAWEFLSDTPDGRQMVNRITRSSGMQGDDVSSDYVIQLLLDAGLWDVEDGGYLIHDYGDYQPSRASVEAERAGAKDRMAHVRANRRRTPSEHATNNERTPSEVRAKFSGSSGNPDPDPDPDPDPGSVPWGSELQQPLRDRVLNAIERIGWQYVDQEEYEAQVQIAKEYTEAEVTAAREACRRTPGRSRPFSGNLRTHLPDRSAPKPKAPEPYRLPDAKDVLTPSALDFMDVNDPEFIRLTGRLA